MTDMEEFERLEARFKAIDNLPAVVDPPAAKLHNVTIDQAPTKPKRHWFLGLIVFVIATLLAVVGLSINTRYNASFGQSFESGIWLALEGLSADLVCIALPSAIVLIWSRSYTVAVLISVIWLGAFGYSVLTTAGFAEQNISDKVAARAHPATTTPGKTITRFKHKTVEKVEAVTTPAATGAADPGAHAIAQWSVWFGYPIQEQTIAMLRTMFLALFPATAGLLFAGSTTLLRKQS